MLKFVTFKVEKQDHNQIGSVWIVSVISNRHISDGEKSIEQHPSTSVRYLDPTVGLYYDYQT